jgi:hypothetical protein
LLRLKALVETYLKAPCAGCGHTRGWHFPHGMPDDVDLEYLKILGDDWCREPHCKCRCFREKKPDSRSNIDSRFISGLRKALYL